MILLLKEFPILHLPIPIIWKLILISLPLEEKDLGSDKDEMKCKLLDLWWKQSEIKILDLDPISSHRHLAKLPIQLDQEMLKMIKRRSKFLDLEHVLFIFKLDPVTFCINQNGSYFLAKYKNSCAKNFSRLPSRASTAEKLVPGPGAYDISNELMASDGTYLTSKMHNSLARRFGNSLRSRLNKKNENPGPGNYKLPSEFGHYISKDAVKKNGSLS